MVGRHSVEPCYNNQTIPEPPTLFEDYSKRLSPARTQAMQVDRDLNENDLKLTRQAGFTAEQRKLWDAAYDPKNKAFREANLQGKDLVRWKYQRYIKY